MPWAATANRMSSSRRWPGVAAIWVWRYARTRASVVCRSRTEAFVGVQTAMGVLEADVVICTVHAWTRAFMEQCGMRLPIKSFVHQRYVSSDLPEPVAIPAINANPQGGYIRPARLGTTDFRILAGGETEDSGGGARRRSCFSHVGAFGSEERTQAAVDESHAAWSPNWLKPAGRASRWG